MAFLARFARGSLRSPIYYYILREKMQCTRNNAPGIGPPPAIRKLTKSTVGIELYGCIRYRVGTMIVEFHYSDELVGLSVYPYRHGF